MKRKVILGVLSISLLDQSIEIAIQEGFDLILLFWRFVTCRTHVQSSKTVRNTIAVFTVNFWSFDGWFGLEL